MTGLTQTQQIRLSELGAEPETADMVFESEKERDRQYHVIENKLIEKNRNNIIDLLDNRHQSKLCSLQNRLADVLCENGFVQVTTPTIISKKFLDRMTVDETHPLREQVFWIDGKSCLRPMLAPNLYSVSKDLLNIRKNRPLRIFEIGSCFRKESEGKTHLKEFTMLNLVEWGLPEDERQAHLLKFGKLVLETAGINDYTTEAENSVVYGDGIDFTGSDGLELASTSMGPHKLDDNWKINSTWVGIGFGLERLLMYREKSQGIHRYSKSISFLDGSRLNIK